MLSHLCFYIIGMRCFYVFMLTGFLWSKLLLHRQDENRKSNIHSKSIVIYYLNTNTYQLCPLPHFLLKSNDFSMHNSIV